MLKKFEILNTIYDNCSLSAKEILVAQYFVYKSNTQGRCYPSVHTIAEECCVSERTVQRATKKLQEKGYINIIKRMLNGKQSSNEYKIIENSVMDEEELCRSEIKDEILENGNTVEMTVISLDDILEVSSDIEWENRHIVDTPFYIEDVSCNEEENKEDNKEAYDNYLPVEKGEVCLTDSNIGKRNRPVEDYTVQKLDSSRRVKNIHILLIWKSLYLLSINFAFVRMNSTRPSVRIIAIEIEVIILLRAVKGQENIFLRLGVPP
jgi:DNA-binding transcriptional regulator YhcF (GntR family)